MLSNHKNLRVNADAAMWPTHPGDVCATDLDMRIFSHWRRYRHNVSIMAVDNHPSRFPADGNLTSYPGAVAYKYTVISRWFRRYLGVTDLRITADGYLVFPTPLTSALAKWVLANAKKKDVSDIYASSYSWADVLDVANGKSVVDTWF